MHTKLWLFLVAYMVELKKNKAKIIETSYCNNWIHKFRIAPNFFFSKGNLIECFDNLCAFFVNSVTFKCVLFREDGRIDEGY